MDVEHGSISRRGAVKILAFLGMAGAARRLAGQSRGRVTPEALAAAEVLLDHDLSEERLRIVAPALQRNLDQFQIVRELDLDDGVEPAPILVAGWS